MRLFFDHGTVVLTAPRTVALDALGALRWDSRIEAYRAPAHRYAQLRAELIAGGIRFDDSVLRTTVADAEFAPVDLRPYQQAAVATWGSERRGMLVLPTGSGKTRVACAAIAQCQVPALCLVPTRILLHQWVQQLSTCVGGPIGIVGDGQYQLERVTVVTFESAYRLMSRIGQRFGLLVVDEAHHFGAGARDEALEMCAAPWRLALTATAPKGDALARLSELVGPIVYEVRIGDLAGSWLADFDTIVLRLALCGDERKRYAHASSLFRAEYERFRRVSPHGTWAEFAALAARTASGRSALAGFRASRRLTNYPVAKRQVVAALLREHRSQRVLLFTADNASAYAIARDELVMPITADIERSEREVALQAFRDGELRALVSAQVLNEGLDVPDADVAIIVGGTRGEREHVQRVGRLLRPRPGKRALVYELVIAGTHEVRKGFERRRGLQIESRDRA